MSTTFSGTFVLHIDDAEIALLTGPTGSVFRYTQRIARETEALARHTCPTGGAKWGPNRRAGTLRSKHYRSTRKIGRYVCEGLVGNSAPYALYVHDGTRSVIWPTTHKYMKFRINGRWRRAQTVSGQPDQPWMRNALDVVMARQLP